jgi:hypothetical protein
MFPRLNDRVHYVAFGTPGGEYPSTCRAAVVTGVPLVPGTLAEAQAALVDLEVDLFVMNPSGTFHNRGCRHDESVAEGGARAGGTWHYPDNCAL